jgi:hypothetical protein
LQDYASGGSSWIIDSGCSNHMMGEKKMFTSYVKNKDSQDMIIFGDGNHDKVKGLGKIAITTEHSISNVFLVESLGYNLLSISQLCHMGYVGPCSQMIYIKSKTTQLLINRDLCPSEHYLLLDIIVFRLRS